jgi:hypothetical protein
MIVMLAKMPGHHTIRRIMIHVVYQEEIERLVGEYNQGGEYGEVYAMEGKAVRDCVRRRKRGKNIC